MVVCLMIEYETECNAEIDAQSLNGTLMYALFFSVSLLHKSLFPTASKHVVLAYSRNIICENLKSNT